MADRYTRFVSPEIQHQKRCAEFDLLQLHAKSIWQMMVFCILLNRTKRAQVDKVRDELFKMYPSSSAMSGADPEVLKSIIKSLGFSERRSQTLIRFSKDFYVSGPHKYGYEMLLELERMKGIGEYALDSYAIFQLGHINIRPLDKELIKYVEHLGADTRPKEKRFVILADWVRSKTDGDWHWISARQLLRLYNFDPAECILIESESAWNRWLKTHNPTQFKIFSVRYQGDYQTVQKPAVSVNWKKWNERHDKSKRK